MGLSITATDPAVAATPVPWVVGPADSLVPGIINSANTQAQSALTSANAAIAAITSYRPSLASATAPEIPAITTSLHEVGQPPNEPYQLSTANFPVSPASPTVTALPAIALEASPVFDVAAPALVDVPVPDPLDALVPAPIVVTDAEFPVSPDFTLPEVPTLYSLNIPNAPTLDLPVFTDTLGSSPDAPNDEFAWSEVEYSSTLLTEAKAKLLQFVDGSYTGLSPEVEQAIWNRGRDRENVLIQKAIDDAFKLAASRGFSVPDGTVLRMSQQALQDSQDRQATISREIAIEEAKLEQSNFHFAFQQAVALEGQLLGHFNQVQNRALQAAQFTFEAAIKIFNAKVQLYQADVQAFGVKAQVFETRLKAALAQLEVYKAELEGQRTIAEINRQQVAVYTAQLEGVKTTVEVYRTQIEAVKAKIESDRVRAEVYKAQLSGFESLVRAKSTEYEGYATRIKAEATKVEMFGQEVGAYKSRVDAYSALVQAQLGVQTLEFKELQEFPMELFKSQVTAFGAQVQAEAERLRAFGSLYETRVRAFAAYEGTRTEHDKSLIANNQLQVQRYTSQAQLLLSSAEVNIKKAEFETEIVSSSLRAAGQLSGQLASAALAARNVSASISSGVSNSAQNSASNSSNTTASNASQASISSTESAQTSVSTTHGDSTSTGTTYFYNL